MRYKILCLSLIAVLILSCQAQAVSIKGKEISTITDILSHARGLGNLSGDTHLELRKSSLLRLNDDDEDFNLHYNIGSGPTDLSLGRIERSVSLRLSGQLASQTDKSLAALAKTKLNGKKIVIASSKSISAAQTLRDRMSNYFYDLFFVSINNDSDGKISQSRFGAWRYPKEAGGTNSGYIKDIKTGIFVEGFDGELVVVAAMEAINDNIDIYVKFSDKKVNARFDFWALFTDTSGDIQYKKLDNLTQTKDGFNTAPLHTFRNVSDSDWKSTNNLDSTRASPYMVIKTATGDFNHDGYANEIAVMTVDKDGTNLWVYQITYENNNFAIKTMADFGRIYTYNGDPTFNGSFDGARHMIGGDIAAGDFNGDGKAEFVVICQKVLYPNQANQYHSIQSIKYEWDNNQGKFNTASFKYQFPDGEWGEKVTVAYGDENKEGFKTTVFGQWGGLKAVALDLNGDGTDEIVFAGCKWEQANTRVTTGAKWDWGKFKLISKWDGFLEYKVNPYLMLLDAKSGKYSYIYQGDPILKKSFKTSGEDNESFVWDSTDNYNVQNYMILPFGQNSNIYAFVDHEISLAAGPFFGQSGLFKERDDIALRIKERDDIARRANDDKIIMFKSNGSGVNQAYIIKAYSPTALIAADFANEGIELGRPSRIVNENDRSYLTILQGIPYHVDTVAADGKTVTANPVNFSYVTGSKVEYSTSSSASDKKNTKFSLNNSIETIFALDSDITRNVVGGLKKATNLYGRIKTITGIIPGTDSFIKSADSTVGKTLDYLNKFTDKVEHIKEGYDKEIQDKEVFQSTFSDRFDVISYVYANQYIWRYPIIAKPGTNFGTVSKDAKFLSKQDFVTFSIYDDTNLDNFSNNIVYQPTHENGNLFSYPATIGNIENYNSRQKDLSEIIGVQFGIPTTVGFTKINTSEHEETESTKVTTGYISQITSLIDDIFGTDLAKIPKPSTGPTFTKKTSNQEKFLVNFAYADGARLLRNYRVQVQAFIADNGALTCGFAVNKFNEYADLFNSTSLYKTLSDPSFVLPNKFVLKDASTLIPEFGANTAREIAMEMRGVRIYASDFNMYTTNRLLEGAKYRINIPLYNASFMPADNVKVDLYWVQDRTESALSSKIFIDSTTVNLSGWDDSGNNKAWAHFNFTPSNMLLNKAGGHYQFYAVIDPDNNINEVHEKRDLTTDSGGNNEGYFEFSVEGIASAQTSREQKDAVRIAANNNNFTFPDISFSGYSTWDEFYDAKIANSGGPVSLDLVITNNSSYTLPDNELNAVYFDPDIGNAEQVIPTKFYSHSFTLFPYETYKTTVVIDDYFAGEMRRAGRDATIFEYIMYGLDILSEDAVLIPDSDPELEVLSGDSSGDSEIESSDIIIYYCDTVTTINHTLSYDTPVYWRIGGVSELINSSESSSDDVYMLPVTLTNEDFNIIMNPEDSETVMTDKFDVTISTIPNVTPAANYMFTVEISEDGENWDIYSFLILDAADSKLTSYVGSGGGGGCNSGFSFVVSSLILAALFIRRRA